MLVSPASAAAAADDKVFSVRHVFYYLSVFRVSNYSSAGNGNYNVRAVLAVHFSAHAVAARLSCELSFVAEIQKGVCTLVDAKNDIAATPAVAAVGTALGDIFLAAEGNAAVSAAAGFDVYFYFIYKHYVSLMPLSYRLSFYFSALPP